MCQRTNQWTKAVQEEVPILPMGMRGCNGPIDRQSAPMDESRARRGTYTAQYPWGCEGAMDLLTERAHQWTTAVQEEVPILPMVHWGARVRWANRQTKCCTNLPKDGYDDIAWIISQRM